MEKEKTTNQFFDINKFPTKEGLLVFAISMSNISTTQSSKKCFEYVNHLVKKIIKPHVGLNFIYSDTLYLYSNEKPSVLKKRFQSLINMHKYEFQKILNKNPWWIQKSFSFSTWNQILLESKEFMDYLGRVQKLYEKDKKFQKYVKEDIKNSKRRINKNNVLFILEEILVFYLILKGKIKLYNDYVQNQEKWILNCYPGKPLKSEIYLWQKNFLKLNNPKNIYENSFYDLKDKKLYDFKKIDLETLKL
jgi:hypothetical protein